MQKFVNQLIEDLKQAENNTTKDIEFSEDYVQFVQQMKQIEQAEYLDAEDVVGVSFIELPPANKLNNKQMQQLNTAIINALAAKGSYVVFPAESIPVELAYSQLRNHFKEGFHSMPGWTIDFCSGYCPDCAFKDYCDICDHEWVKEELKNK